MASNGVLCVRIHEDIDTLLRSQSYRERFLGLWTVTEEMSKWTVIVVIKVERLIIWDACSLKLLLLGNGKIYGTN
jgi:hypothetical protein